MLHIFTYLLDVHKENGIEMKKKRENAKESREVEKLKILSIY